MTLWVSSKKGSGSVPDSHGPPAAQPNLGARSGRFTPLKLVAARSRAVNTLTVFFPGAVVSCTPRVRTREGSASPLATWPSSRASPSHSFVNTPPGISARAGHETLGLQIPEVSSRADTGSHYREGRMTRPFFRRGKGFSLVRAAASRTHPILRKGGPPATPSPTGLGEHPARPPSVITIPAGKRLTVTPHRGRALPAPAARGTRRWPEGGRASESSGSRSGLRQGKVFGWTAIKV